MTSSPPPVYVWVWLPDATEPVVAGVLAPSGQFHGPDEVLVFRYAASYRARAEAISLFIPELPLDDGVHDPRTVPGRDPLPLAGCLRDAAPDAWGRRVVNARLAASPDVDLSEATYLLASGSDRIGALDFQESPVDYVARSDGVTLEQLVHLAELVEAGQPIPPALADAATHGTSIGGARPKALLTDDGRPLIAKFSSTTDTRPAVQAEAVAMMLAPAAGVDAARVEVVRSAGRDVLLVERFDRPLGTDLPGRAVRTRRQMVSMLTVRGRWEMNSRHETYADLAREVRTGPWADVAGTLRRLYARLVFNVVVGNTDDHLRNHAAFWDGRRLTLTPAFDLAPQPRSGRTASQAIGITADGRRASQLWLCRAVAGEFHLGRADAQEVIDQVVGAVRDGWADACDRARLTSVQRADLWGREFMNPYVFDDEP